MYIKNIFGIKNYKGLDDGFKANFDDITYIIGDNAKNKTTVGSLPLWILTGYTMNGSNKEAVSKDSSYLYNNTMASMTIIDNEGSEHTITRCKGKDNFVMLDGIRTTQELLTKFYKDIHPFICSYNPSYFRSLKLAEQRELLLRILPAISSEEAFELLENEEKQILEEPVVDIKGFAKARRAEIKELNCELNRIEGSKDIYIAIAIQKEEEPKIFEKQKELEQLENEYERLISNTKDAVNIEDVEKDIKKIEKKISDNINIVLKEYQEKQQKELSNLANVSSQTSTCPTCKQEIKNENLTKALTITYKKKINELAKKIEQLKVETKELLDKKKIQIEKYKIMKTPSVEKQAERIEELKNRINILQKEKSEIDLFNKEVAIKHNNIVNAKKQIEQLEESIEKINEKIDKYEKQIKIITRLNLLMIQEQMKKISQYLNKVTIEFSKVDERTGEILDVYEIKYNGKNYEKLSKSYKLRADIEIAQLINKITGINTPMFIDDVESITELDIKSNIQTILSIVVKYNELEILYSYPEVLLREKESINKKLQESSNLLQNVA